MSRLDSIWMTFTDVVLCMSVLTSPSVMGILMLVMVGVAVLVLVGDGVGMLDMLQPFF